MQTPHQFHPEMGELICQVLAEDPLGRVVLHKLDVSQAITTTYSFSVSDVRAATRVVYIAFKLSHITVYLRCMLC